MKRAAALFWATMPYSALLAVYLAGALVALAISLSRSLP